MTVAELLEKISSRELAEWVAYNSIEPFGEFRQDIRIAKLWCLTANINRDTKKCPTPFTVMDFLKVFEEVELPDEEELRQKLDSNLKRIR
jgi:hypothetical protein